MRQQALWRRRSRGGQGGNKGKEKEQLVLKIKEKADNRRIVADKEQVMLKTVIQ